MDELLQQLAKERREKAGAAFELHPATRSLLQGEVKRAFPAAAKRTSFFALWPRLALVTVFTALLTLLVVVLNTPRTAKRIELTQRSDSADTPPSESLALRSEKINSVLMKEKDSNQTLFPPPAAAPIVPPQEMEGAKSLVRAKSAKEVPVRNQNLLRETPNAAQQPATKLTDATAQTNTPQLRAEPSASPTPPAIQRSPAFAPAAESKSLASESAPTSRSRFMQQNPRAQLRRNLLSPPLPKILQTFEFVRTGNRIQLVDGDGSVYSGEVLSTPARDTSAASNTVNRPEELSFQASGTNPQLHGLVSIRGTLTVSSRSVLSGQAEPATPNGELENGSRAAGRNNSTGSIRARISVGGTNHFEIQAVEIPK